MVVDQPKVSMQPSEEQSSPAAEISLVLELVEYRSVVEVRVREDSVNPAAHGAQLRHGGFLDADPETRVNELQGQNP